MKICFAEFVSAMTVAVGVSAASAATYYPTCKGTRNCYSYDWNKDDRFFAGPGVLLVGRASFHLLLR